MNFAFVKKELTLAEGLVVPRAAGHVLGDVGVHEERATGLEIHVGVADVGLAFAEGLHFGAMEDEAGFEAFEDVIVVGGRAVLGDDLFGGPGGLFTLRLLGVFGGPGHNLSFYLMKRLIRMSGTAAPPGPLVPSYRSFVGGESGAGKWEG